MSICSLRYFVDIILGSLTELNEVPLIRQWAKNWEEDSLGSEGGFKSLLRMGTCGQGWAANRTSYIPPEMSRHDCACTGHRSLATCSQVINTTALCNDYTFRSGLPSPRNLTWFTRPFSSWEVWCGHKTMLKSRYTDICGCGWGGVTCRHMRSITAWSTCIRGVLHFTMNVKLMDF